MVGQIVWTLESKQEPIKMEMKLVQRSKRGGDVFAPKCIIIVKMKLSICENPSIISYAHHGYPNAIIQRDIDKSLLELEINCDDQEDWVEEKKEIRFIRKGKILKIESEKYAVDTECFYMRLCKKIDEINIKIKRVRSDFTNGVVNLIISSEDYLKCAHEDNEIYRIGIIGGCGLYCKENKQYLSMDISGSILVECSQIKIERIENVINFYAFNVQENKWLKVSSSIVPETMLGKKMFIGINTNLGESQYYNWKYLNYMQLSYTDNDRFVWLDYYMYPRKNYSFNYTQQFLDIENWNFSEFLDLFGGVWNGVLWCINHGYYIELILDEYYIKNRLNYQKKHYMHNNLLYGYDSEKDFVYILGYDIKIKSTKIQKELLDKCIDDMSEIKVIKYKNNNLSMEFDLKHYVQLVRDFLEGVCSGDCFSHILPSKNEAYGLRVFDILLSTKKGNWMVQEDTRTTFLLYEHALIMRERLDFFKYRSIITEDEYIKLVYKCDEMVSSANILKNLTIKNNMTGKCVEKIMLVLHQLYERERNFYVLLLNVLKLKYYTT